MSKTVFAAIAFLLLAAVTTMPLAAQTFVLKANIPFEFTVGNKVLPAGEYMISSDGMSPTVQLRGEASHVAALTMVFHRQLASVQDPAGLTKLTFNRYGNRYFLSEVDDGYLEAGFVVPESHTERELAQAGPIEHDYILAFRAQR